MNKVRDIFMYYGRNLDHSYPALRLNNTIAVLNKKAINQFESHMLLKLIMETHPNEISIYYNSFGNSVWGLINELRLSSKKCIPQFEEVNVDMSADDLISKLDCYNGMLNERTKKNGSHKKTIVYFKLKQSQFNTVREMLMRLIEYGRQVNMFIILLIESGEYSFEENFLSNFPIRICGAGSSEATSDSMIGCNLAAKLNEDMSFILWTSNTSSSFQKMFAPYFPDTFLSKFIF